ncbi:MAG: hypothetical protein ABEJ81_06710 [Haloferacaceae archaeon]
MSGESAPVREAQPLLRPPSNAVAYVAVLAALVAGGVHLLLAPRVIGFDRTTGILFYLNGLGFVGGVVLFLSRYWRRELYLVAGGYALVTIVAFFVLNGRLNALSTVSKAAETVVVLTTIHLYRSQRSS